MGVSAFPTNTPGTGSGIVICTSSTRPASPFEGQVIFETDTDYYLGYSGSAWEYLGKLGAWNTYTPSNTNITVGNGTQVARWVRGPGRTVHVAYDLTFGSTTAFTGVAIIGLPIAASASGRRAGSAWLLDSGTSDYGAFVRHEASAATVAITPTAGGQVDSTSPFTWTTNDRLSFSHTYESVS